MYQNKIVNGDHTFWFASWDDPRYLFVTFLQAGIVNTIRMDVKKQSHSVL